MRRFRPRWVAAVAGVSVLGLVISGTGASAGPRGGDDDPVRVTVDGQQVLEQVTPQLIRAAADTRASVGLSLVTGDTVQVGLNADGDPVLRDVVPAPRADGRTVAFHTITRGDDVYVFPSDALALIHADVLDRELFNVGKLAEHAAQGTVGEVPVIMSYAGGYSTMGTTPRAGTEGVEVERTFEAIDASAATIDGGDWWQQVTNSTSASGPSIMSDSSPLAGIDKIWLNELYEIQLDDSVPQVGAPVAWDNGYDGTGVSVAVLDSGIDADHPDVAGKVLEAVDFTGSASGAVDGHGHGTHVAATIAGTGAASDGQRAGVAPGANLLVGKVCDAGGSCPGDAILAGMQWAAESGASVVSMSLGGGPTDGTDPLSQMVNQLSAAHDTLFVIAAGNAGPSAYTVGAPAAADSALAVAAVDKSDQMADFSSRGPRVGDDALKPEIAAPGVDIVAARAEGTAMGSPVDEHYTTASGISMATPHVSGAAAIVAQQNPDLSGQEVKALLMGTALDLGHDIYAQGTGRLDLSRAVDPGVFSDGNVNLGRFAHPHEPISGVVGYHNLTEASVTLSLSGQMTAENGTPAPEGLFTLDADEVTVPADGTAEVSVTVDGGVLGEDDAFGSYSGLVEARDSEGGLRATSRVQVFLEPETHQVTVTTTAPDGATDVAHDAGILVPADDRVSLHEEAITVPASGEATVEVFRGTYSLHTSLHWTGGDGAGHDAVPTGPEVVVNDDTTVELDLNQAQRVAVDLDRETETYSQNVTITRVSETGGWTVETNVADGYAPREPNVWLLPTEEVTLGTLSVHITHSLVSPVVTMRAIAGGPPIDLAPRYATPDVSVSGPAYDWGGGSRTTRLPVPRLDSGGPPVDLAYAGTGTAEDFSGVDIDGKLALIAPTATDIDFATLRDRVGLAADAGAVGVLVALDNAQVGDGPAGVTTPPASTIECEDGWESCPDVEPYAAVPMLTVPAERAAAVIDRLGKRPTVKAQIGGEGKVTEAYGLSFAAEGRVPGELTRQVDVADLDRVEHRIHDDTPAETSIFSWSKLTPDAVDDQQSVPFPLVATQREMTTFVGPGRDNSIDQFRVGTIEFEKPYVVEPPENMPDSGTFLQVQTGEVAERVLTGDDTIDWNSGPSTIPATRQSISTDQGFSVGDGLCAGCREGDTLWPTMYTANSAGYPDNGLIGLINDTGIGVFLFGMNGCGPPKCEISLYDAAGGELERTLTPIGFGIGDGTATTGGEVPSDLLGDRMSARVSAGVNQEGTSR